MAHNEEQGGWGGGRTFERNAENGRCGHLDWRGGLVSATRETWASRAKGGKRVGEKKFLKKKRSGPSST